MAEATAYPPTQEATVEALAPVLPGYNLTADEWRAIMLDLRLKSRTSTPCCSSRSNRSGTSVRNNRKFPADG